MEVVAGKSKNASHLCNLKRSDLHMRYAVCRMQKVKSPGLKGMQFQNKKERESRMNENINIKQTQKNNELKNSNLNKSYAVNRIKKIKSPGLKDMQFNNQRERESRTNEDIDRERKNENYDLQKDKNINYNERVKDIIDSQKTGTRKTRKDA